MLEPDFLELLARQCGKEMRAAEESSVAECRCPMGLYRHMCAQPYCTLSFPTYGRKMLPYEWRSHLQASHPEDCKTLLNLVEDLENEALNWWASQPETERVYIKATLPLPASFLEQKAEGVPGSEPSDQNPGTDGCEGGTNPIPQVHQLLSPSLSCPFVCGIEHLVPGADYAKHCLSHLAELQTLAAVLDTLVLRAYIRQSCPFKNYAAQGEPGPCRLPCKQGDWWAHIHCTHLTDALATSMHLFRRGERTLEAAAAAAAAAQTLGAFQLHCPIPRCVSHTPTPVKLVAHFVGHLRPLHPDNDTAHLLLTRAKDMGDAGRAGAAAARQPFLAASGTGPKNGKHRSVRKGKQEQHVCYTVVRGSEGVKPFYLKHQAQGQQHVNPQQQQQQQQQRSPSQHQQQLSNPQIEPQKPKQAAPGSSPPMYCPFPHCCTAPVTTSGLEQPVHSIQLPTTSNLDQQTRDFERPEDLEAHAFSAHSAELLLAAHQFACTARTESRTGMLVCPVRSVTAPLGRRPRTAVPQGQSRSSAQRHLSHHHSARGSQRAGGSEQLQRGLDEELQDHQELHTHAKDLVQHMHAQHAPLAMVVAGLSKGLVRLAAASRGQPEKERCPLCPPSPAAVHLHDEAPVFGHLLDRHPSQLLQVFHCLLMLASGRDLSSATAGQCLLHCGASGVKGGTLGAMLHAVEEHAQQVLELSAGAAAEALPNDAKAAAFSPSKGSPRKQALSLGPQLPSRLLSNASRAALRPPNVVPAEQLATRDSGVQASRVPPQALAREHLLRAYGPPNRRPKQKVDAGVTARPDTRSAGVRACPDTKSTETMAQLSIGQVGIPAPHDLPFIQQRADALPQSPPQQSPPQQPNNPDAQATQQPQSELPSGFCQPASSGSKPEESGVHAPVQPPAIKVAQEGSKPAPSAGVPPSLTTAAEMVTTAGAQPGIEQQTGPSAAAIAARAPSKPLERSSLSTSTSMSGPQTPTANVPHFATNTPLATSPRASVATLPQPLPRPSAAAHPPFMHLDIENDQKLQQLPTDEEDQELNSTLGSALGGTPRGDQDLDKTGSTIVMPSLSAVLEEGDPEQGSEPPAAAAAAAAAAPLKAASLWASSPLSEPAAKQKSKQGKESEPPIVAAAAAAAPLKAASPRASSPLSEPAAKQESKQGKEGEQGKESKPPVAAAAAAAAAPAAASPRASSPLSEPAAKQESKQGKEGEQGKESKPPVAAAAAAPTAASPRASSPLSESAAKQESKQGKEGEQGKENKLATAAAAAAAPKVSSPRASSPLSRSAAKEGSESGKEREQGKESKPFAAAAAAPAPAPAPCKAASPRVSSPSSKSAADEESEQGKEGEQGKESKPASAAGTPQASSLQSKYAAQEENKQGKEGKPASSAATPRASSPQSKYAAQEENKQGKESEPPAAAAAPEAAGLSASSLLSESAAKGGSGGGKESEQGKESKPPAAAAPPPSPPPPEAASLRAHSPQSTSAAKEESEQGQASKPSTAAEAPKAASPRALGPSSKPAKEEHEQGKEGETPSAPAAVKTATLRASSPPSKSAAKGDNEEGKESKEPAAAAAAAVKENGPNKESKPALAPTGQIPAGNEQKKPGAIVKTEIKKTAEDSEEFEDIPEEVFDYDSDV